ncbi:MAG: hypothetical protein IH862_04715 [Chloroflexi bacterium]|nr:hypothetical protein [Chloroflexota bacterium]
MYALWRWTLTLAACGVLIAACGRSDALTLMVEDGEGAEGEVISVELALLNVTSAIAGFGLTVSVQDSRVARIVSVQFPDYSDPESGFELTSVKTDPVSGSVSIGAVDLKGTLQASISRHVLATLNLELLRAGETRVFVADVAGLDDLAGNALAPDRVSGVLSIQR